MRGGLPFLDKKKVTSERHLQLVANGGDWRAHVRQGAMMMTMMTMMMIKMMMTTLKPVSRAHLQPACASTALLALDFLRHLRPRARQAWSTLLPPLIPGYAW